MSRLPASCSVAGALIVTLLGCGADGPAVEPVPSCENRGDQYFAGFARTSDDGKISVELVSAEPAPPANSYTNKWTLRVIDAETRQSIVGALVVAGPYMVDHGHGAPNVIAGEVGDGVYMVDPLSLKMNGLWDITLKVTPADGAESRVVMSFCVQPI